MVVLEQALETEKERASARKNYMAKMSVNALQTLVWLRRILRTGRALERGTLSPAYSLAGCVVACRLSKQSKFDNKMDKNDVRIEIRDPSRV